MAAHDDILSVGEAAALLKLHRETVRRLARERKIPAFKVGGAWRFSARALMASGPKREEGAAPRGTVLVVDDDEEIRNLVGRQLTAAGFEALEAANGDEAVTHVERERPDMVLLDLVMPGMTGPEVLGEIRARWGQVPVVVVTGYPDSALVFRALEYGPITLLAKPIDLTQLRALVKAVLVGEEDTTPRKHSGGA